MTDQRRKITAPKIPRPKINGPKVNGLTRRVALLLPIATLPGCSLWDAWFGTDDKKPLPGKREPVIAVRRGLEADKSAARKVTLPPPAERAEWPQEGGVPSHVVGHPALRATVSRSWSSGIGSGGGYRRKITAQPVVSGGRVFTMDSEAVVRAFDIAGGSQIWSFDTEGDDTDTTNVGGGIAADGGMLYVTTGRGDLLGLDAATGNVKWRVALGVSARSAPTVGEGKLFFTTIDNHLQGRATADGKLLWSYQAGTAETLVLGMPAPAYVDGLVVTGFGSGELAAVRASSGTAAWADSLAAARGRNSLADLSAIRGRPAVKDGRVFATSLGGLVLSLDLRSGRRLWEREITSAESPLVAGNWVFVLTPDAQVAALAAEDGAIAWVTQLDGFENMEKRRDPISYVGPVLAGDRLLVGGSHDKALALSPYTGAVLGEQDLPGKASLAPTVAGGTLYVLTDDATLSAFR